MLCTYSANEVQFRFHCHKSKMVLSILDRRISNIRVNYPVHSKSLSVDVPTEPTHLHSQTVRRIQQKNTPFRQKIQNLCSPNFEMLFLPLYPTIVRGRPISILKKNNSLLVVSYRVKIEWLNIWSFLMGFLKVELVKDYHDIHTWCTAKVALSILDNLLILSQASSPYFWIR